MNSGLHRASNFPPPTQIHPDDVSRQLKLILGSQAFRNAPLLQRFLTYITQKVLEGRAGDIKEYSIATEVLNRSSDFDPKTSPLVRVEARRLRERLAQYYAGEGASDSVVFDIPRGGYVPTFVAHSRLGAKEVEAHEPFSRLYAEPILTLATDKRVREPEISVKQPSRGSRPRLQWWGLGALAILVVSAILIFMLRRGGAPRPSAATPPSGPELALKPDALLLTLWSNLLGNARTAYIYYRDLSLPTVSPSQDPTHSSGESAKKSAPRAPRVSTPDAANPKPEANGLLSFDNVYAGGGEVQGVYALTRLLVRVGIPVEVRGCKVLPQDAVSQHTVILLGSDLEKELRSFHPTQENFVFEDSLPADGPRYARIVNLHPLAGESQFYETQRDPTSVDTMVDWALLSVMPGIRQQRKTVVMAGLTHTGTEAVAEFCASGTGVVSLLNRLGTEESGKTLPPFYQVLLRVTIKQGSIIDIAYVAGRVIRD